jgi:hypothetical protein
LTDFFHALIFYLKKIIFSEGGFKMQDNKEVIKNIKELPVCEKTETAEHSRLWENDEPCDCGIGNK